MLSSDTFLRQQKQQQLLLLKMLMGRRGASGAEPSFNPISLPGQARDKQRRKR
jgi:hypothetical protein